MTANRGAGGTLYIFFDHPQQPLRDNTSPFAVKSLINIMNVNWNLLSRDCPPVKYQGHRFSRGLSRPIDTIFFKSKKGKGKSILGGSWVGWMKVDFGPKPNDLDHYCSNYGISMPVQSLFLLYGDQDKQGLLCMVLLRQLPTSANTHWVIWDSGGCWGWWTCWLSSTSKVHKLKQYMFIQGTALPKMPNYFFHVKRTAPKDSLSWSTANIAKV